MNLWESIISSWQVLHTNKMRSSLTILGIVIGVSAVVFLVSFGRGHEANITGIFESMGANAIYITSATSMTQGISGATASITLEDAEALANPNRAPSVALVAPMTEKLAKVVYGNENATVNIMGATPDIAQIISYPVAEGEFISEQDVKRGARVAVLGSKTATDLFGTEDPIGKTIRVSGTQFEVIGVLEKKGGFIGSADDFVLIPLTTMQSRLLGETSARGRPIQTIAVKAVSTDQIDAAKEEVTSILRQRHNIREGKDDDFTIIDMQEILSSMREVLGIMQVFLGSVGAISLLVGGIGIMNIMLVSVTERTREIGIRKAVGAKRRDILRQFLVEASMLSLTGGIIGLTIAALGTWAITGVQLGPYPVKAPMSPDIVIIAISVAVFVGLASGIYPAYRAAGLDPIESLRHE
ncbi:MAG: FtsX-like permease family protein [Chloroflexi bacterium]|nr:FtsX-like permease family protein [Chloroflexota bacterium]